MTTVSVVVNWKIPMHAHICNQHETFDMITGNNESLCSLSNT